MSDLLPGKTPSSQDTARGAADREQTIAYLMGRFDAFKSLTTFPFRDKDAHDRVMRLAEAELTSLEALGVKTTRTEGSS